MFRGVLDVDLKKIPGLGVIWGKNRPNFVYFQHFRCPFLPSFTLVWWGSEIFGSHCDCHISYYKKKKYYIKYKNSSINFGYKTSQDSHYKWSRSAHDAKTRIQHWWVCSPVVRNSLVWSANLEAAVQACLAYISCFLLLPVCLTCRVSFQACSLIVHLLRSGQTCFCVEALAWLWESDLTECRLLIEQVAVYGVSAVYCLCDVWLLALPPNKAWERRKGTQQCRACLDGVGN